MSSTIISASGTLNPGLLSLGEQITITGAGVTVTTPNGVGAGLLDRFTVENGAIFDMGAAVGVEVGNSYTIGSDGTLELGSGISVGVFAEISFDPAASGGELVLDAGINIDLFTAISQFQFGDTIDFEGDGTPTNGSITSNFSSGETTFTLATSGGTKTFQLAGDYTGDHFTATSDGGGGFTVSDTTPCFAQGTKILTPDGEIPIEYLQTGDRVVLQDGATAPIIFIGRRRVDLTRHNRPDEARPVRIPAGALDDHMPARDLVLSPDHALFIDDVLVPARDLVDGMMIRFERAMSSISYYHIELPRHAVLVAQGMPAESFLNVGHRGLFENSNEPLLLHPDFMNAVREAKSCAPLVTGGDKLAAIRARLHARARKLGHCVVEASLLLLKTAAGHMLEAQYAGLGWHSFALPPASGEAVLLSPVFIPAETDPYSTDRRVLGVAISAIMLDGHTVDRERVLDPRDIHVCAANELAFWTRGAVRLTIPAGTRSIAFAIAGWPKLWREDAQAA